MYLGQNIKLEKIEDNIYGLVFDSRCHALNKLDKKTISELREAINIVYELDNIEGLIISSNKNQFIAGADITEFIDMFKMPENEIIIDVANSNYVFNSLEKLPVPTVCLINGYALGGGFELALCADYRIMSSDARVGLPEVNLGLIPGFGGTVRLPRVANLKIAVDMISNGKPIDALKALEYGIVNSVTDAVDLKIAGLHFIKKIIKDGDAWRKNRLNKFTSVKEQKRLSDNDLNQIIHSLKLKHGELTPAVWMGVELLQKATLVSSDEALNLETHTFAKIARTQAASSLVQIFLNEQHIKKLSNSIQNGAADIKHAGVVGAGIMGGGIAFVNLKQNIDVTVYDINKDSLKRCEHEFKKLMDFELSQNKSTNLYKSLNTTHKLVDLSSSEIVIEAVTESIELKKNILRDIENIMLEDSILATNTSSITLNELTECLKRPERFVGLHFFNPVTVMPLVEVIQGQYTSEQSVKTAVKYVLSLGKKPVIVKDCSGFLVNRILTPYMSGFLDLVANGQSVELIDSTMKEFGWPMGPGRLHDVVGLDTASNVSKKISEEYSNHMNSKSYLLLNEYVKRGFFGKKSGIGFYKYSKNEKGNNDPHVNIEILRDLNINAEVEMKKSQIIDLLMIPMLLEAVRCIEQKIVNSAAELDMAILMGLGFPRYLGGPLKYIDWIGIDEVIAKANHLGMVSNIPRLLIDMSKSKSRFYA